ncbi:hypothetical protein GCM10011348_37670 [Marinobacterium nitratireducens]|uniref:HTH lysR-type domain-containing protein n=1 Tax=Marinobacterium nitratireducens TaxID=518897 RepID=A0A917ZMG0_9GAMM|nr:LysR family transcriptional regulator [Marinobacterium nitratireducens]GGO86563.1 hypothetical protein GCM10011348_37670 [Marinobacterium nitratireducens]
MDPRLLKQLSVIVRYGSLSRAAERLNVTQPTLTRAIQTIENRVGGPVLVRTSSGVRPTEIGTRLAEVGQRIDDYAEHTDRLIEQWKQGLGGEVRVGVGSLIALGAIHDFFDLVSDSSNSVIHFVTATAATLIQQLNAGELELALTPVNTDAIQNNLTREVIFHDELRVFVGARSPLYGSKAVVAAEALKSLPWIASGARSGIFDSLDMSRFSGPARMLFTGGIDMVISMLQRSDVLVTLPYRLTMLSERLGDDHVLNVDTPMPRHDIALWFPERNLERPDVQDIAGSLKRYFQNLDRTAIGSY